MDSKKYLLIFVHSNIVYNNQEVEVTTDSSEGMDKQNVAYTCNGISPLNFRKVGNLNNYNVSEC